jgi:hypothetical protein
MTGQQATDISTIIGKLRQLDIMLSNGSITKEDHGSMKSAVHRKFAEF